MKKINTTFTRMTNHLFALLVIMLIGIPGFQSWAQVTEPTTGSGEIETVEIEIRQQREITLPSANRNFEKIPPRPSEPITPPIKYDFQSFSFSAPLVNAQIRPLKLKAASENKIYGGFVRAGYGNYASPLLEGYITSRKDRNKLVGAHLYHFSSGKGPVDGKNSGSGNSTLSVFGRSFNENIALSGSIDVENRSTHFYGYPEGTEVDASDIRQVYNHFRVSGDLSNTRNTNVSYKLGGVFSYVADKYDAREAGFDVTFNNAYKINDKSRVNVDASYSIMSRKDAGIDGKARNLFIITPTYSFSPVDDLNIRLGISAAYENDSLDSKDFHLYPVLNASYPVSPSVDFYVAFSGSMEKVSLQTLSYKNIWIESGVPLNHTNKYFEFDLGINAKLGNKVAAHTGVSIGQLQNMYFFVNSLNDPSKFTVEYETGFLRRTNLFGSLSYAQSEKVKLMVRGDIYAYGTDELEEAWHMPRYKMNASASFNIASKMILGFDVIGQGGMKALEPITDTVVKLDGAIDLNAKVEYLFSDSFSIFVQFNNITGNNYPLFLNYPVRGFQFLGGLTWSF